MLVFIKFDTEIHATLDIYKRKKLCNSKKESFTFYIPINSFSDNKWIAYQPAMRR